MLHGVEELLMICELCYMVTLGSLVLVIKKQIIWFYQRYVM